VVFSLYPSDYDPSDPVGPYSPTPDYSGINDGSATISIPSDVTTTGILTTSTTTQVYMVIQYSAE